MYLKNYSETELLMELSKRVREEKISWKITYFYNQDNSEMELWTEKEKFSLSFTQEADIERSYLLHKIYKNFAPTIKKIEFDKEMKVIDKDFENMKLKFK